MPDRHSRLYLPPLRIDITARQGVPRVVPLVRLARAIRAAAVAGGAPRPASVGLILTDDTELAVLNRQHMGRRGPTDVLSFPLLPAESFAVGASDRGRARSRRDQRQGGAFVLPPRARVSLGDIAVSVERAIVQAGEGRGGHDSRTAWNATDELLLLVTHGTLHLCGWDHADPDQRSAMQALERAVILSPDELESFEETVDILEDRKLLASLRRSRREAAAGDLSRLRNHVQ